MRIQHDRTFLLDRRHNSIEPPTTMVSQEDFLEVGNDVATGS